MGYWAVRNWNGSAFDAWPSVLVRVYYQATHPALLCQYGLSGVASANININRDTFIPSRTHEPFTQSRHL